MNKMELVSVLVELKVHGHFHTSKGITLKESHTDPKE